MTVSFLRFDGGRIRVYTPRNSRDLQKIKIKWLVTVFVHLISFADRIANCCDKSKMVGQ